MLGALSNVRNFFRRQPVVPVSENRRVGFLLDVFLDLVRKLEGRNGTMTVNCLIPIA